jgi:hypothetical protein
MVGHTWPWSSSSKDSSRAIGASNRALGTSRNSQEVASSLPVPRGVWWMDQASSLSISPCMEGCRGEDCRQLSEGEWCTWSGRYVWLQTLLLVCLHHIDSCNSNCKGCRFVCHYIYRTQTCMSVGVQNVDLSTNTFTVYINQCMYVCMYLVCRVICQHISSVQISLWVHVQPADL